MECKVYKLNELRDYRYVIVLSKYAGKILLSRHKERDTWETQGGHIENGETPIEAAKRELFEESGAVEFSIKPVFDYWAGDDEGSSTGVVFFAEITKLSNMPESEMEEVKTFSELPKELTYPDIAQVLFVSAKELFN